MITIQVNGLDELIAKIGSIDMDAITLDVASTLKSEIKHRIHTEGRAADGGLIGTYSAGYMKVRTGNYDETRIKSGKNKGQFREKKTAGQAGVFTRGTRKGQARPVYNRGNDNRVILSLTRTMEKDMDATHPMKIENGFGIGFTNEANYMKALWNDNRYGRTIYSLTENEKQLVEEVVHNYLEKLGLI
ncbi:MAG: hypothetical protein LBR64_02235 [Dysgonamonadaceae bacterium]|jgi:hypothetical protein|nr:hypothetical protein [Dysgonamonadaceae bacterium]